ncbi:hypothetical protein [Virgibacillus salexigens]|uniref:Uncharacterized protein n=1 Tax=Virgibacillus massiliensis TaxID=1462526 RepID=A0A024QI76_9BACI|nr:hypothetical protein [Virgibacillus massiliensis]CDQ41890.1 hypothetical protein BN990_04269 [Virgibacillus massiliensis]
MIKGLDTISFHDLVKSDQEHVLEVINAFVSRLEDISGIDMSHLSKQMLNEYEEFKKSNIDNKETKNNIEPIEKKTTNEHPFTIYNVFHELKINETAKGKNSGVNIIKNLDGEYVDVNGSPIRMTSVVMNDVYYIKKEPTFKLVELETAIEAFNQGKEIMIDYEQSYVISKEDPHVIIPFAAFVDGAWYVKGDI